MMPFDVRDPIAIRRQSEVESARSLREFRVDQSCTVRLRCGMSATRVPISY